jgi:hypothetical protein
LLSEARIADKCRNFGPVASIGGICGAGFTAPKYLGSMVRIRCETTDCPDIMKPVESALQVRGLTKRFDRLAVDALDLTVQPGEFYALVGPNGAGKTTTLRMVAGLLRPDAARSRCSVSTRSTADISDLGHRVHGTMSISIEGRAREEPAGGYGRAWVTCGRRPGKNFLTFLQHWSGAVTCPACRCGRYGRWP